MIKDRIAYIIELKRVPKEKTYKQLGVTASNFRGKAKTTPVNSDVIEKLYNLFPDINLGWLITGEGDPLTKEIPKDMVSIDRYESKVEECIRLRIELERREHD